MGESIDRLEVKLTRVTVPAHDRTRNGRIEHVDTYTYERKFHWRELRGHDDYARSSIGYVLKSPGLGWSAVHQEDKPLANRLGESTRLGYFPTKQSAIGAVEKHEAKLAGGSPGGPLNALKTALYGRAGHVSEKKAKQAEALRAHQAKYDKVWADEQNWLPDDNGNVTDHTKRTMPDSRRAAEALGEHAMGGSSGKVAALRGGLAYAATRAGQRLLQQQDSDLASLPHPWAPSDDRTYRSDIGSVTRMANGQWAARHKDYPAALGRFPTPLKAAQAVEKRHRRK